MEIKMKITLADFQNELQKRGLFDVVNKYMEYEDKSTVLFDDKFFLEIFDRVGESNGKIDLEKIDRETDPFVEPSFFDADFSGAHGKIVSHIIGLSISGRNMDKARYPDSTSRSYEVLLEMLPENQRLKYLQENIFSGMNSNYNDASGKWNAFDLIKLYYKTFDADKILKFLNYVMATLPLDQRQEFLENAVSGTQYSALIDAEQEIINKFESFRQLLNAPNHQIAISEISLLSWTVLKSILGEQPNFTAFSNVDESVKKDMRDILISRVEQADQHFQLTPKPNPFKLLSYTPRNNETTESLSAFIKRKEMTESNLYTIAMGLDREIRGDLQKGQALQEALVAINSTKRVRLVTPIESEVRVERGYSK